MSETLHVLAFPHTETTSAHATCAYTQRVVKFCRMMYGEGRKVILYSGEENEAPCDEHVIVVTKEQQIEWFGAHDDDDLDRGGFDFSPASPWWVEMNGAIVREMRSRADEHDLLCISQGRCHGAVADAFPTMIVAEFCVGYEGIIIGRTPSPAFAAFESHTHRHLVYGLNGWRTPREVDTVIPNAVDPDELPFGDGSGGYVLFLGRLIVNKGPEVAAAVADALGMKLVVAGPGATEVGDGYIQAPEVRIEARDLEYVGPIGIEERGSILGNAAVVMTPTVYLEPFGGVAVEAMMTGTPVISTNFGAFTETVCEGISGYRFQTMREAVDLTALAIELPRGEVRRYAQDHYSLEAVRHDYGRWFDVLDSLWHPGGIRALA